MKKYEDYDFVFSVLGAAYDATMRCDYATILRDYRYILDQLSEFGFLNQSGNSLREAVLKAQEEYFERLKSEKTKEPTLVTFG